MIFFWVPITKGYGGEGKLGLSLKHLEVFYAVMTCGSLNGAASILCVSQPAVSKSLKLAEYRLVFSLFKRVKGKLMPTQEAHILFEQIKSIYVELKNLQSLARNLANNPEGSLTIGCLPSLALCAIPQITAQFIKENPGVFISIGTQHSEELQQQLNNRQLDLAITFGLKNDSGLISTPIAEIPLVYIDSINQCLPVKISEIDEDRWIHPNAHSLTTTIDRSRIFKKTVVDVQTYYMAAEFVKQGVGSSITDLLTAFFMLPDDMVFPIEPKLSATIYLIQHRDLVISKPTQKYISMLQHHLTTRVKQLNERLYTTK